MKRFGRIADLVRIGAGFAVVGYVAQLLRPYFHLIWIGGMILTAAAVVLMLAIAAL